MKTLLLHIKNFESEITKLATRPSHIQPEPITEKRIRGEKAVLVLFCAEEGDKKEKIDALESEIRKMMKDTGHHSLIICPFGHLSQKLADSETTKGLLRYLEEKFGDKTVQRAHFGSHKTLVLDVFGHKGNIRWREF